MKQAIFLKHNSTGNAQYQIDGKIYTVNDNDFCVDNYKADWAMYAYAISDDGCRAYLRVIPGNDEATNVDNGPAELDSINYDIADVIDIDYAE